MKKQNNLLKNSVAAFLIVFAATLLLSACSSSPSYNLILKNGKNGQEYIRYPVDEGDEFTVTFIHSVNLRPYSDTYRIEGGDIFAEKTTYYQFGAGVQTELNEGEKMDIGDDGEIIVSNIHKKIQPLSYIVGTVSDHVLTIHGKDISLRDLCGRNATVVFSCERRK